MNRAIHEILRYIYDGSNVISWMDGPSPLNVCVCVRNHVRSFCSFLCKQPKNSESFQFFGHVEEAEWAIEIMKELKVPVACTMRMGPTGDIHNVSPGECALRMARAGQCKETFYVNDVLPCLNNS